MLTISTEEQRRKIN